MYEQHSQPVIHVCVTCRHPDLSRHRRGEGGGAAMPAALQGALDREGLADQFELRTYECLGSCSYRCRISIAGAGRWSWLFGKLSPNDDLTPLARFLRFWLSAPDGFVPKPDRPAALGAWLLGRVPPN